MIYQQELCDLSQRQIDSAFAKAIQECKYIPKIAELRIWAAEAARVFQRQDAEMQSRKLLAQPSKPDDWRPASDSVWEEIERRADAQEVIDLAYVEQFTDEEVERVMKLGHPYPGNDKYVDWFRRKEARDRRDQGISRPRSRKQYGPLFETVVTGAREPGSDDE